MDFDLSEDSAYGRPCLQCGDELETWGAFMTIVPTLFCKRCCSQFKHQQENVAETNGRHVVTKSQAIALYGCTVEDLNTLNYDVLPNSLRKEGMRLYLGAEVYYLGEQRLYKRLESVKRKFSMDMEELDPILKVFWMDGYLRKETAARCAFRDVERRFSVLERAAGIRSCLRSAYPRAIFDFCLTHPDGGAEDFLALQDKCQSVFRLEAKRIFSFLAPTEAKKLMNTCLKDAIILVYAQNPG